MGLVLENPGQFSRCVAETGCPSQAEGKPVLNSMTTAQVSFLVAAGFTTGYFCRMGALPVCACPEQLPHCDARSSGSRVPRRVAGLQPNQPSCSQPGMTRCGPQLGFRTHRSPAASSQESVPSKWSGFTSDCALQWGEEQQAPRPATSTGIFNKLNGFTGYLQFVVLTHPGGVTTPERKP